MYLDRRMLANIDWRVAGTALALIGVGILTIWSANLGSPSPPKQTLYLRQTLYAVVALFALLTATFINYRTVARFAYPIFGVVLALLVLVSLAGEVGRGAQRWIRIGAWTLQPSEFMKLALIVVLARYFEDHKERLGHSRLLVIPAMVALLP
ncbi:MAG: FtsW/RodA/SpoVE family cell cycle protein, partial [Candidatus Methylomirabilales bacterium]